MHFTTDQQDATTIFRLKEERLDSRNAGQLKAEFLILAQPDVETLIIDLSDVRHVDSARLSALLLAQRQMRIHSGEVRLVGLNDNVRSLLAVTQLDRIFPIFGTVNDALDAEPSLGDDEDDEEITPSEKPGTDPRQSTAPLAPGAPSAKDIRAGAIAAGGSLGAAALAEIMMTPYEEDIDRMDLAAYGDDEDYEEEEDNDLDEFDDDLEEEDDLTENLDEEDDAEDEDVEDVEDEDLIEDDDFEDDDWDDEELEEDEEEDY